MTPTEPFTARDYLTAAELETGMTAPRLLDIVPRERLLFALFEPYAGSGGAPRERPLPQHAAALAVSLAGAALLPERNDDVAVMALVGFLAKNGRRVGFAREHGRAVALVRRVLDGEAREDDLAAWIAERIV